MPNRSELPPAPLPTGGGPPPIALVLSDALAASRIAAQEAVDALVDANARLDEVEIRATSQLEHLIEARDAAIEQRRANCRLISELCASLD